MAISIRPLHRSYCPLNCACVGARRAAGGVSSPFLRKRSKKNRVHVTTSQPLFSH